ncbi:LytR C-terminal domain-containing protein [Streptomyces sp. NPDC048644]|uniref:LytR C-terminal domain-containing protein n=1 Tax=Streptomyces sp. NPDC048644 TaxID=3365582 RepID=UPI00371C807F
MSDRQDPYGPQDPYAQDPYAQGQQAYTYDAYGRPVYHDAAQQPYEQRYDQYGQPVAPAPAAPPEYGYDPYGGRQEYGYEPYGGRPQPGHPQEYDPYGHPQQQQVPQQQQQQEWIPQQPPPPPYEQQPYGGQGYPQQDYGRPQQDEASGYRATGYEQAHQETQPRPPEQRRAPEAAGPGTDAPPAPSEPSGPAGPEYHTEQFSFIEEPDEDSEDVIDWLKFTESRTERREEAKRRGRSRVVALTVVLVLLVIGGVGYLWWAGKLPGLNGADGAGTAAGAGQKRDVLVVHLRDTKTGNSSTALLVDNETTDKGTTVLLPNNLIVSKDDGTTTTLGKSVKDEGTEPTRDSLNTLLGADLKASWRLDTPYLENLVETVGGISVDTNATVPGAKKGDSPLVKPGSDRLLNGQSAVAYATYQGPGESQGKQLERFGQVMQATLKKVSSDADGATATVKSLLQVLDPPLTEAQLGSSLAQRAELAKTGAYGTTLLPVQQNGTLSAEAAKTVVKDVLGGTVKKTDPDATPRVSVRNATGDARATGKAQVALVNGGYTFVDGGTAAAPGSTSDVTYADDADKEKAAEVAKTLGLPDGAVTKAKGAANADITVVLGQDFKG